MKVEAKRKENAKLIETTEGLLLDAYTTKEKTIIFQMISS